MKKNSDVHLICPFWNPSGGTEWHTITLYEELKSLCRVHLWTENPRPARFFVERYPINIINLRAGRFPKSGVFIFTGAFYEPGKWIFFAFPRKVFISYTTFAPERLAEITKRLSHGVVPRAIEYFKLLDLKRLPAALKKPRPGLFRRVEVMYASELLKKTVDYPGIVELSPVDYNQFAPIERTHNNGAPQQFVVGRLSRDDDEKHHPASNRVYRELTTKHDCKIRIMGGTCLTPELGDVPNVELLPANYIAAERFLQTLNCFYYRTSDYFTETFGRVVFEAMACELPVVCHNRGGYADFIESGRNGFLFDAEADALAIILELKRDVELRRKIGKAARETVKEMFSPAARREIIDYYLS